ncbi:MAG: transporter associated domain-containing protein [Bacteroidia bacterium]|nr:CBS domain-containing protein [Bacteroidia bacterium]MDW8157501.1 transporter associated domain-containing protein [Bacteroidia bacterium]
MDKEDPYSCFLFLFINFSWQSVDTWSLGIIVFFMLSVAGLLNGYEVAFFSLEETHLDLDPLGHSIVAKVIFLFRQKSFQFRITLLLLITLFNFSAVILLLELLERFSIFDWQPFSFPFIESILASLIVLYGCILLPRIHASSRKNFYLQTLSLPLLLFFRLLFPLTLPLSYLRQWLLYPTEQERKKASFEELKQAIDQAETTNKVATEERQILKALVNLSNIPVRAIMRARVDIKAIDINAKGEEVFEKIKEYRYSRLPVYQKDIDQIVGILYVKDLLPLLNNPTGNWQNLIRKPYFVPATQKIDKLFETFKQQKLHIAIVVDEFGGIAGLVTLKDILEEIFGEITEEDKSEQCLFSQLSENEFIFDGKTPLLDVCKITGLDETVFESIKGDSDSLGGLILELEGRFPEVGEVISYGPFQFQIEAVTSTAIKRVRFTMLKKQ